MLEDEGFAYASQFSDFSRLGAAEAFFSE